LISSGLLCGGINTYGEYPHLIANTNDNYYYLHSILKNYITLTTLHFFHTVKSIQITQSKKFNLKFPKNTDQCKIESDEFIVIKHDINLSYFMIFNKINRNLASSKLSSRF